MSALTADLRAAKAMDVRTSNWVSRACGLRITKTTSSPHNWDPVLSVLRKRSKRCRLFVGLPLVQVCVALHRRAHIRLGIGHGNLSGVANARLSPLLSRRATCAVSRDYAFEFCQE